MLRSLFFNEAIKCIEYSLQDLRSKAQLYLFKSTVILKLTGPSKIIYNNILCQMCNLYIKNFYQSALPTHLNLVMKQLLK